MVPKIAHFLQYCAFCTFLIFASVGRAKTTRDIPKILLSFCGMSIVSDDRGTSETFQIVLASRVNCAKILYRLIWILEWELLSHGYKCRCL